MKAPTQRDRRVLRRETHSPRSGLAITVALLVIVGCGYLAAEIVLQLLGQSPLLIAPTDAVRAAASPADDLLGIIVPIGIGGVVLGLLLVLAALLPGHRSRHSLSAERLAVVIDDEVIASALARSAATAAGLALDAVRVTVGRRRADIGLTPTSGVQVDAARVAGAAAAALGHIDPRPSIRPMLRVATTGRFGAGRHPARRARLVDHGRRQRRLRGREAALGQPAGRDRNQLGLVHAPGPPGAPLPRAGGLRRAAGTGALI